MATTPTPAAVPAPLAPPPGPPPEIRIVSHSTLFYWWPVWAVGFLMAIMTFLSSNRMVDAPKDSQSLPRAEVPVEGKKLGARAVRAVPAGDGRIAPRQHGL